MTEVSASEPQRVVANRYALGPCIGAGGMGVVYQAHDRQLSRTVALKLLPPDRTSSQRAIARFEREALAAARIGHPNIVRVLDFGRDDESSVYLAMEQLSGETLDQRLADRGTLPVSTAIAIHLQLLDALAAAHEAGILHRDVKPSNVFLTELGDGSFLVKLLDFGIAYMAEEPGQPKLTVTGVNLGTPAYMAPERLDGKVADERTDLYSVGVCLYESLCGELPMEAETPVALYLRLMANDTVSVATRRSDVPRDLSDIIDRALARDPALRFPSARAMADALRALQAGPPARAKLEMMDTLPAIAGPVTAPAGTAGATLDAVEPAPPPASAAPTRGHATQPMGSSAGAVVVPVPSTPERKASTPEHTAPAARPRWAFAALTGAGVGVLITIAVIVAARRETPVQPPSRPAASAPESPPTPPPPSSPPELPTTPSDVPAPNIEIGAAPPPVDVVAAPEPEPVVPTVEPPRPPRRPRTVAQAPRNEPEPSPRQPATSEPEGGELLRPAWRTP
jgi:serine/threonine-protein kinase